MSYQVKLSDVFYDSLAEYVKAQIELLQANEYEKEDKSYNVTLSGIYEYDTKVQETISKVFREYR